MSTTFFLHGLDSSGKGTKGSYFANHFPEVLRPDFHGDLEERLAQLTGLIADRSDLRFIGTSFGGLMATCHAIRNPAAVSRLILLAPALNYADFQPPATRLSQPTLLVIGDGDTVTPPALVLPKAEATFADLEVRVVADDHLLRLAFPLLDWPTLLRG